MADHSRADLVIDALRMAVRNCFLVEAGQYMSEAFAATAEHLWIRRSMGRTGVCFDKQPDHSPEFAGQSTSQEHSFSG
ncbi:hypothetical protein ACFQE5_05310 [Pseudonocardia hispaniensis]|uniref:Uncharacterized protein n=1 Tax=Pseudonocardia hispaniensis TaxID=904933 RepID=A0ABW1IYM2_9PSEU